MSNRIRILAAVAATLAASLLAAPSANAEDQRPCVSVREYNGIVGAHHRAGSLTRGQVEDRWDVRGLDWATYVPWFSDGDAFYVRAYPRCGYSRAEGWYGAAYHTRSDGSSHIWATVAWRAPGATAHGRP